jgi:hypothetical protein
MCVLWVILGWNGRRRRSVVVGYASSLKRSLIVLLAGVWGGGDEMAWYGMEIGLAKETANIPLFSIIDLLDCKLKVMRRDMK